MDEIELRKDAGQHRLVRALLTNFPSEGVAGGTLERVREMLGDLDAMEQEKSKIVSMLAGAIEGVKEPAIKEVAERVQKEIAAELNDVSAPRMAAFLQLADGGDLSAEQRAALAISGWLVGANQATDNLPVALSIYQVRAKVLEYLRSESREARARLLVEIGDMEGGTVERIAELLRLIKPPMPLPDSARGPGFFEIEKDLGGKLGKVRYLLQLPPEYDPLRSYPAIVTLGGAGYPPEVQMDFWAGPQVERGVGAGGQKLPPVRMGQATRRGYVVIAVDWLPNSQFEYKSSAREHHTVLTCVRDGDPPRGDRYRQGFSHGSRHRRRRGVGHRPGAPRPVGGVMPFLATAKKYAGWYWENAEFVPWYFVAGEMDGGKTAQNARELDRYLKRARFDATFVEYLGRGHDSLSDETQRVFDWMDRNAAARRPSSSPSTRCGRGTTTSGGRSSRSCPPRAWSPRHVAPERGVRAARLQMRKYPGNKLGVIARARRTTVWLSPDVVDFDEPVRVELNGRSMLPAGEFPEPNLGVLLEDVRTRGDRFRPFWAKVESR